MKNLLFLLFIILCVEAKSQSVIPQKGIGSKFSLSCANLYFEVDSAKGARITSFKLAGKEIMYVDFKTTDMVGSTFWPSPQSVWNWPPAVNLDSKPYRATIRQNKIVFSGSTDPKSMLRFYKTIAANAADTSIIIDYCIKNEKTTAQKWAPWEITRVLNNGLTVFAKGTSSVTGDMTGRTEVSPGYGWYDQDKTAGWAGSKFFCDGKGWLAHVINDELLFIKKFEDVAIGKAAPAEAEIEVYTAPDKSYTELENQGTYTTIAAKDSITWRVKWVARKLPVSVSVSVGSESLTSYIENVLKREAPLTGVSADKSVYAKVFPNPASGFLIVETGLTSDNDVTFRLVDLQGRIVLSKDLKQTNDRINIENLTRGNYIYDLTQGRETLLKGQITIIH